MAKGTIQQVIKQEQMLDQAQAILHQIIKQTRNNITAYRRSDLRKLEAAYIALDSVTLRKDLD